MINICPYLSQIKPYQAGKSIDALKREFNLGHITKLASNENPFSISKNVHLAVTNALGEINRYPDSFGFRLKKALVKHLSISFDGYIDAQNLVLGNGSNDVLELIARACVCTAEDEVIFSEYAFAIYGLLTQALGAKAIITPAENYSHHPLAMLRAITDKTKLIFIANPNNPTGTFLRDHIIREFLGSVPSSVCVVLDEAYFEYLSTPHKTLSYLSEFENLVITRSFSKAYGLAGLRVGYGIAHAKIIDYLNRIRQPFNVSSIAQVAAIAALDDSAHLKKVIFENKQGLAQLSAGFDALGLFYIPSKTNFISVKVGDALRIYKELLKLGIIVRLVEMPGFVRVSVGRKKENTHLLKNLAQIL